MDSGQNVKGKKRCGGVGDYFVNRTKPGVQPSIRAAFATKDLKERVNIAVVKWFYHAGKTFNAANVI